MNEPHVHVHKQHDGWHVTATSDVLSVSWGCYSTRARALEAARRLARSWPDEPRPWPQGPSVAAPLSQ
jgi:hypothetical protein